MWGIIYRLITRHYGLKQFKIVKLRLKHLNFIQLLSLWSWQRPTKDIKSFGEEWSKPVAKKSSRRFAFT